MVVSFAHTEPFFANFFTMAGGRLPIAAPESAMISDAAAASSRSFCMRSASFISHIMGTKVLHASRFLSKSPPFVRSAGSSPADMAIDEAAETGALELNLQGLTTLPAEVEKRVRDGTEISHPRLETLQVLKMADNRIPRPQFSDSLACLTVLWLRNCRIELLDDSIGCLTSLKMLSLEGNQITYLPKNFTRLRKLEEMSVARNKLYELPAMIGQLTAITKLDLDLNPRCRCH